MLSFLISMTWDILNEINDKNSGLPSLHHGLGIGFFPLLLLAIHYYLVLFVIFFGVIPIAIITDHLKLKRIK